MQSIYKPKNIKSLIMLGFTYTFAKLPQKWQFSLGKVFGKLLYKYWHKRRKIAFINLKLCFPEYTDTKIKQILKKHFESLGIGIFELANSIFLSEKKIQKNFQIAGLENLKKLTDKNKPVLILTYHNISMYMVVRMLNYCHKIAAVYTKPKNPVFAWIIAKKMNSYKMQQIEHNDLRTMLKTLKYSKTPLWYAHDQDYGISNSIFSKFFAMSTTATTTATARITKKTNAYVVPICYYRDKYTYKIKLYPPLQNYPSDNDIKNTLITNKILEDFIKIAPEQYLWIHRRFKNQPQEKKAALYL